MTKRKLLRTIANSLHAGSDGCAPTPNQYFALATSSLTSFHLLDSPSRGSLGMGSYVPMTSIGLEFLADLYVAAKEKAWLRVSLRANVIA